MALWMSYGRLGSPNVVLQLVQQQIGLLEAEIKLGDAALNRWSNVRAVVGGSGTDGQGRSDEKVLELHDE